MENNQKLTNELVKRIFGDLGIVDSKLDNKFGIYQFPIKKKFIINEMGREKSYPLYSALIKLDGNDIRFISVKLDGEEKILLIKENDNVFIITSDNNHSQILLQTNNKIVPISIYMQLQVASLIEFITQHGILLEENPEYEFLFEKLASFVEQGVDPD